MTNKITFKRIVREDFPKDYYAVIDPLALIINPAIDTLTTTLNNGVTFKDNVASQVKDLTVIVDDTGKPTTTTSFKSTLTGNCQGIICILAQNTTSTSTFPTGQPFVSFSESSGQVQILNVTGLQAGAKYKLRIIAVG